MEGLGEAYAAIEETFQSFQENFKVSLKWKVCYIDLCYLLINLLFRQLEFNWFVDALD